MTKRRTSPPPDWVGIEGTPSAQEIGHGPRYTLDVCRLVSECVAWALREHSEGRLGRVERLRSTLTIIASLPHFIATNEHYGIDAYLLTMTHSQLSRVSGISEKTVSKVLNGMCSHDGPLKRVYLATGKDGYGSAYVFRSQVQNPTGEGYAVQPTPVRVRSAAYTSYQ